MRGIKLNSTYQRIASEYDTGHCSLRDLVRIMQQDLECEESVMYLDNEQGERVFVKITLIEDGPA